MTNMTYAQALEIAINLVDAIKDGVAYDPCTDLTEVSERLTALKDQLAKRSTAKTPTKVQKENAVIKEKILETLAEIGCPTTITDMLEHGVEGFELTNQKTSALLRQLIDDGKVVKTIEKKKAMFALA